MQDFRYESLTTSGETRSGILTANDRADVIRQLIGRGETATTVAIIEDVAVTRPAAARKPRTESASLTRCDARPRARRCRSSSTT